MTETRYAHYFRSKGPSRYEVIITLGLDTRRPIMVFCVGGKREARKIAAQHNAKPWNF